MWDIYNSPFMTFKKTIDVNDFKKHGIHNKTAKNAMPAPMLMILKCRVYTTIKDFWTRYDRC